MDPDPNQEAQKHVDPVDPDPNPQHWGKHKNVGFL
jgi:hypothetical protein